MAKARFESYVEERVGELASAKRARLQAAYDAEVAKIEKQRDKYLKTVEDGVEALVRKVLAQAVKDGCAINDVRDMEKTLSEHVKGSVRSAVGPQMEYDYGAHKSMWPEGSPVRKAQDALEAFDAFCEREARRIVVYKVDLGMKPEAFERMLAEVADRINRE